MRLTDALKGAAPLIAAIALTAIAVPEPAQASCIQPQEEGSWRNADPNTRSLSRIKLRFVCQDVILNGEPYPPGPPWYVHVRGKCSPTDCDWGEVGARQLGSGHIYAFYDFGFAKYYVFSRMSAFRPGQLWVWTWTNFTDPGRADFGTHDWFVRE